MITEQRYTIKHTINMGNYESIVVEHSVLFDTEGSGGIASVRESVDAAIKEDLRRAAQVTSLGQLESYIHDYIEEVYN